MSVLLVLTEFIVEEINPRCYAVDGNRRYGPGFNTVISDNKAGINF